jgi:hypothetical protein
VLKIVLLAAFISPTVRVAIALRAHGDVADPRDVAATWTVPLSR